MTIQNRILPRQMIDPAMDIGGDAPIVAELEEGTTTVIATIDGYEYRIPISEMVRLWMEDTYYASRGTIDTPTGD